jgi:hypothetical protein
MKKPTRLLLLSFLLVPSFVQAQPTWRTAGLLGDELVIGPPHQCGSTWYDPEVFVFPDGNRGFLAQAGMINPCTANAALDSHYSAKHNSTTLTWQVPANGSCPTVVGRYADTTCPTQEFLAPNQPLASPAIAKVGSRYFMAFSGGNVDIRKGHIFWAYSDNGVNWVPLKWDPKPVGFNWKPLIYPKHGSFCGFFGIPQLSLTYDPSTTYGPEGTFYLHFNYHHLPGELDTYTFRFNYTSANGFGLGSGMQVCVNNGPQGSQCNWQSHSGAMVFDYDGQPPNAGDPLLLRYAGNGNNYSYGGGSIAWVPSHGYWLHVFTDAQGRLRWQSSTSLASGVWSAPGFVDMTRFHSQMLARYPSYVQSEVYYGGLYYGSIGTRTGLWLFQPADYRACPSYFTGLGIFAVALNFS